MARKLNARQRLFVQASRLERSGHHKRRVRHASRATTTPDAGHAAYQLLRKPHVLAEYERQLEEKEKLVKLEGLQQAQETALQGRARLGDVLDADGNLRPFKDWPLEVKASLAQIEVEDLHEGSGAERTHIGVLRKIKLHDKRASQELFLKWAGKLKDRVEIEGGLTLDQLVPKRKPQSTEGSK
jgi:phage terminase small subunit